MCPETLSVMWNFLNWDNIRRHVRSLQQRIAKAIKTGAHGKAKALQWLLTHSFYAKLLAVKRVTENKGKNTSGVDKVIWNNQSSKMKAVRTLSIKGYKALPLRRGSQLRNPQLLIVCRRTTAITKFCML